ncbi:uncharacterized protein LOC120677281 isoform X4 [Panicum virgatum]|uniref:uncharacterized protein LOC120677281 isoform X4 n=1 Tax=Panicum virgatum TaxID=38727 RepID=UPI0019D5F2EF|nr:uncharacterized protein LOC120677281 isoform X4 [Panicum virgatum]
MRLSPEVHLSHGAASCMMEQLAAGMKRWFELVSMKMMLKRFCRYLCAILLVRISQLGYTLSQRPQRIMKQQFLQSQYGTFGSQEMQLEMVRI